MVRVLIILLFISMGCVTFGSDKKPLTVVLSFDYEDMDNDGSGKNLEALLEMLDSRSLPAAFFVLGAAAEKHPLEVWRIHNKGHLLGMHTYYHDIPLFNRQDAEVVGRIYGKSADMEWNRSFKTPQAFRKDLEATREAIERATGVMDVTAFRAPSLVVNWVRDDVYYDILKEEGIRLDSSVYQDFENPRGYYVKNGVVVVPLVTFESRLKNSKKALALAEKCSLAGVPFHLVGHLKALDPETLKDLENFLDTLEERYQVTYLRLDKVHENIY
jgi:peptidoglycan/xylan/chitin deacetylase (PgdA/CDA1 family)